MAYSCDSPGVKPIISATEKGGVMAMPTPPGDFPQGGAHENPNDAHGSTTTVPAAGAPITRRAAVVSNHVR
jgi:hypothetical protein